MHDGVLIGAGATVLGPITIGARSQIGAMALVRGMFRLTRSRPEFPQPPAPLIAARAPRAPKASSSTPPFTSEMSSPDAVPPRAEIVPGPLTAAAAAELFGVIADPDRLRIIGLALAAQSITVDELEAVVVGDLDELLAHLEALADERIITLNELDGVVQVSARSPYTADFVAASRAWLTDLLGGPVVKA